jgi:hypothetical protein
MGFKVVLARRNEKTPRIVTIIPAKTRNLAISKRPGKSKVNSGAATETSYINSAAIKRIAAGGIFNSSIIL